MTAVSTARRSRWRTGFVRQSIAIYEHVLSDSLDVTENTIPIYARIVPGDRIESVADSKSQSYLQGPSAFDSFAINDNIIVLKSTSPVALEAIGVVDGNDLSVIRDRENTETLSVTDTYLKSVARNSFLIIDKELRNSIDVYNDDVTADAFGIRARTLSDAIAVSDFGHKKPIRDITRFSDAAIIDSINVVITRYISTTTTIFDRITTDEISINDSVQATFTGISQRTISEAIGVVDFDSSAMFDVSADSLATSDAIDVHRFANQTDTEYIPVTDVVIPTRNAIAREKTVTESLVVIDQALPTYVEFVSVSADILIGIEAQ